MISFDTVSFFVLSSHARQAQRKEGAKGEGMKQVKIQVAPYSSLIIIYTDLLNKPLTL